LERQPLTDRAGEKELLAPGKPTIDSSDASVGKKPSPHSFGMKIVWKMVLRLEMIATGGSTGQLQECNKKNYLHMLRHFALLFFCVMTCCDDWRGSICLIWHGLTAENLHWLIPPYQSPP